MSGSRIIESWERGQDREPPALVTALLRLDEDLLWAVRLHSHATAGWHIRIGLFLLAMAAHLLFIGPWFETVDEYCNDSGGRCRGLYYIFWPAIAFVAGSAFLELWAGRKASKRPWILAYAISDNRAFLIDERRPKAFEYVYLRLHKAQIEGTTVLGFAEERKKFIGLDYGSVMRAYHWATKGREALLSEKAAINPVTKAASP